MSTAQIVGTIAMTAVIFTILLSIYVAGYARGRMDEQDERDKRRLKDMLR